MRISDWSSDVCSSDLPVALRQAQSLPSRRRGANGLGEGSRALPCHLEIIAARSDLEPDAPRIADQRPAVGMIGQRPAGPAPVPRRKFDFGDGAGGGGGGEGGGRKSVG